MHRREPCLRTTPLGAPTTHDYPGRSVSFAKVYSGFHVVRELASPRKRLGGRGRNCNRGIDSSYALRAMSELNRLNRLALEKQLNINEVFSLESKLSLECQEIPGIISLNSVSLSVFVVSWLVVRTLKTLDSISLNLKVLYIVSLAKRVVHR